MTTVRITTGPAGKVEVTFPFDALVVDILKTLPSHARRWDPARKVWQVSADHLDGLVELLEADGHRVIGFRGAGRQERAAKTSTVDTWADILLDAVGPQWVEPVHRALARVLHPDVGGDNLLMQALNAARDRRAVRR